MVQGPARWRETDRAVVALEQGDAEVFLERLDLPADGRLGDEQLLRREREAQAPAGGFETAQEVERGQSRGHSHSSRACVRCAFIV